MKGANLAAGLLFTTLAFALAFLPRRLALAAGGLAIVLMVAIALIVRAPPSAVVFAGCWISLIAIALSVYWPGPAQRNAVLPLVASVAAGTWAGLLLASDERWQALPLAAGMALTAIAATALVKRGWEIALRVATSWLLAVALLVGAMPYLVPHPGYVPDHRE